MFGSQRRKAIQAAINFTAPIVNGLYRLHGQLPDDILQDPYVIGYMQRLFVAAITDKAQGKIKGMELGLSIMQCFETVWGPSLGKRMVHICDACYNKLNDEFERGSMNAEKYVQILRGSDFFDEDPDIIQARKRADQMYKILGDGSVAGALLQMQLFAYIRGKLEE